MTGTRRKTEEDEKEFQRREERKRRGNERIVILDYGTQIVCIQCFKINK